MEIYVPHRPNVNTCISFSNAMLLELTLRGNDIVEAFNFSAKRNSIYSRTRPNSHIHTHISISILLFKAIETIYYGMKNGEMEIY